MSATTFRSAGRAGPALRWRMPPAPPWRAWVTAAATALDHLVVLMIRLAVLGAIVWCGTVVVQHVTATLQQIAGEHVVGQMDTASR